MRTGSRTLRLPYTLGMLTSGYAELDHTADLALHVWGPDMQALLAQAGEGMLSLLSLKLLPSLGVPVRLRRSAPDREILLVEWLDEWLNLIELRRLAPDPASLKLTMHSPNSYDARFMAHPISGIERPIKAVTYNEIAILDTAAGLEATIVFDV
jgi:SHS2 domain-containing protein